MDDLRIINCHAHTFTAAHVPRHYPSRAAVLAGRVPWLLPSLRRASGWLPYEELHHRLRRLETFHRTSKHETQRDVLLDLLRFYPRSSRHVILPMDMAFMDHGAVVVPLREQHDGLAELAGDPDYGAQVIPFATFHPDRPDAAREVRRCVEELGFKGLKLYPRLGFAPTHPILMAEVYPLCVQHDLPVVSHCSRGGVSRRGLSQRDGDAFTEPDAFLPVLDAYPTLRVSLAHFGGWKDWRAYLTDGFDPADPAARSRNWVARICDLIAKEGRDNLYTDVSYTIFHFAEFIPLLRLFMEDPRLRRRILFGSDFYMTRQEELSEKAVSIRLRDALGEANFRRIAETNPQVWLGEAAEEPMPRPKPR